jgi:uncharacterized protein
VLATLTALLLTASPASAAPARATAPDDTGALAVEISRLALPPENHEAMAGKASSQAYDMMVATIGAKVKDLPPGFLEAARGELDDLMKAIMPPYQEVLDLQAGLLVKHYSPAELKEMLAFYRTPLGQKVIRTMPEVMNDVMAWMQATMQRQMPAAMERFQERMKVRMAQPQAAAPATAP